MPAKLPASPKPEPSPAFSCWHSELDQQGFALTRQLMSADELLALCAALEPAQGKIPIAGLRGLAAVVPAIRALAESPALRQLITPILGSQARLVRSLFFNKTPEANWGVPWHQDLSIAVAQRVECMGFGGWSVKNGVPHVQPPVQVLENMLTLRLHLDAADADNGALWLLPGSHRLGRIGSDEVAGMVERTGPTLCTAAAGDVLLMRPLTLHASFKASSNRPRRVIHLEFAGIDLPAGMAWAENG